VPDASTLLYVLQLAQSKAGFKRGAILSGTPEQMREAASSLESLGYPVLQLTPEEAAAAGFDGGEAWCFTGQNEAEALRTRDLYLEQRGTLNADKNADDVTRKLGRQLGYPDCCVESFLSMKSHSDNYLLRAAYYRSVGVIDPRCLFLSRFGPTLMQHAPCTLNCAHSLVLAERTLHALTPLDTEYAEAIRRALECPLVLVDSRRYIRLANARPTSDGYAFEGYEFLPGEWNGMDADWRAHIQMATRLIVNGTGQFDLIDTDGSSKALWDPQSPLRPILIEPGKPVPQKRPVSVAIIETFPNEDPQALSSFFPSLYAHDLMENGIRVEHVQHHRSPRDESLNQGMRARLIEMIETFGITQIWWFRSYERELARELKTRFPHLPLVLIDNATPGRAPEMTHFAPIMERRRFVDAVLALGADEPSPDLSENRYPNPSAPVWRDATARMPHGVLVNPAHPLNVALQPTRLNPHVTQHTPLLEIAARAGCPYQHDCATNPLFAGLDLSETPFKRGCSYCSTRLPLLTPLAASEILESWLFQVQQSLTRRRHVDSIRILDQGVAALLPPLMTQVEALRLPPLNWLVDLRVSEILNQTEALKAALTSARAAGQKLDLFCIGFENFSDDELARFNKGVNAAENIAAVALIDELSAEFPDVISSSGAASGFILFTPWTTLADLKLNAEAMRATRFERFRSGALFTKLRLSRDTPLYLLAERDGLLASDWPDSCWDIADRTGYLPEEPWRFKDPNTERVFTLLQAAAQKSGALSEGALLADLVELVHTTPKLADLTGLANTAITRNSRQTSPKNRATDDSRSGPPQNLPDNWQKMLDAALARVTQAPADFDAQMALARTYVTVNRTAEALRAFVVARKLNPHHPDPVLRIGELLIITGQTEQARRLLEQASSLFNDPSALKAVRNLLDSLT
jgi:tetratricopeptide (TPR) repeat protein